MLEIGKNALLAPDVYEMTLVGDASAITAPGQFINIRLDGLYLRRPISVCDWGEGWIRVIYKVVGKGTAQMAQMTPGQKLDVLTGLGNGYDLAPARGKRIALVGGGVGIPPLYGLAKRLGGEAFCCVLGFNRASEIFYAEEFAQYGKVVLTTADDVLCYLSAGASAVQVGAQNLVDPLACKRIIEDLPRKMAQYGIESLQSIIGRAHQ